MMRRRFTVVFIFSLFFMASDAQVYPKNYFRNPLNIPMQLVANFGEDERMLSPTAAEVQQLLTFRFEVLLNYLINMPVRVPWPVLFAQDRVEADLLAGVTFRIFLVKFEFPLLSFG